MPDIAVEITTTAAWLSQRENSQVGELLLETFGSSLNVVTPRARSDTSNWKEHGLGLIWMPIAPRKALGRIDSRMEELSSSSSVIYWKLICSGRTNAGSYTVQQTRLQAS